jgi:cobalamin biosynthesis Mg chelatase CobN
LPQAIAAAKKTEATAKENPATVSPAPAKTLTAAEISELLRQSQRRQSNTVALAPAPLIIRGGASQTNPLAPDTSSKGAVEPLAQTQTPSVPVSNTTASAPASNTTAFAPVVNTNPSPERSAAVAKAPPAIAPASPVRIEPSAPAGENDSASGDAIAPSTPPIDRLPVATTEPAVDDTREENAHSPAPARTAVLAQQEPLPNAPIYLMAAVALLVVAFIMGWLYIRSIRYVPRPSLISRSLEKERK